MRLRRNLQRVMTSIAAGLLVLLFRLLRNLNPDRTAEIAAGLMRGVGRFLPGHRVARANLQAAFEDKTQPEIEQILKGMWDNVGRLMMEYAVLDKLWDYTPTVSSVPRIALSSTFVETIKGLQRTSGPALFFGAHLANWELLPIVSAVFGVKPAMLFRPPGPNPVANEIVRLRSKVGGCLIDARSGAALQLRSALRHGLFVGMLVDQHSVGGIEVTFFNRSCMVNSTLARLARQFDCPVFGGRAIRIAGGRYRLEFTRALELPRDQHGKIEIAGTMQFVTSIVEQWIREHPEQWLWMYRRWR